MDATETQRWADAVAVANIPTLLLVLVQTTGDLRWLRDPYRPTRTQGLSDNDTGGFSPEIRAAIREAALGSMLAWADGQPLAIEHPSPELLVEMMSVSLGETIPVEYAGMIAHELAFGTPATEVRAGAGLPEGAPPGFRALIIGAGMSGICAAIRLREAGIPFTVIERNAGVGGTWLENRYPGCGVDVPSHIYSYSFAQNDWTKFFALRDEILAYFEGVADRFGVTEHVQFNTEVVRAVFDAESKDWQVELAAKDGTHTTVRANVVISAVGAFNKPRMPEVKGVDTFGGQAVHTARWPREGVDLAGKRVAVIGTGASAMQIVPEIAPTVAEVRVFQKSKQWSAPFEKFRLDVPDAITFLMRALPLYHNWYRIRIGWAFNDKNYAALQKDPQWPDPDRSLNVINDGFRRGLTRYIQSELGDRHDLLSKVLPDYPPYGKRMLLDNGWYRTLRRDNVHLFTESVTEVVSDGVISESGEHHRVDVIIWATGFDVVHFLAPIEIIGRSGERLHDMWQGDDARAYLGTAIPDFPNFFCLYGPNTQFGHGGSLTMVIERQMRYIVDVIEQMLAAGSRSAEVRADVNEEYNRRVDAAHENMVWTHTGMSTYYRNSKGRIVVNNPFRIVDVWAWTEKADLTDYIIGAAPLSVGADHG